MSVYQVVITTHNTTSIEASSKEEAESKAKDLVKGNVEESSQVDRYYNDLSKATIHVVFFDLKEDNK